MALKRVSFGFDLRVNPELQGENESQREQRLVPTLTSPVSADPSVWSQGVDTWRIMGGVLPDYANALYLAKRMDLLLDDYRNRDISASGLVPVCITSVESNLIALAARFDPSYFESHPEEQELLSEGWNLVGFDVVDLMGLISGLKGCGYTEPTWSQLRGLFGRALNEFGLFGDCQTASQFADSSRPADNRTCAIYSGGSAYFGTPLSVKRSGTSRVRRVCSRGSTLEGNPALTCIRFLGT